MHGDLFSRCLTRRISWEQSGPVQGESAVDAVISAGSKWYRNQAELISVVWPAGRDGCRLRWWRACVSSWAGAIRA